MLDMVALETPEVGGDGSAMVDVVVGQVVGHVAHQRACEHRLRHRPRRKQAVEAQDQRGENGGWDGWKDEPHSVHWRLLVGKEEREKKRLELWSMQE